jgi:hypothetical protein
VTTMAYGGLIIVCVLVILDVVPSSNGTAVAD